MAKLRLSSGTMVATLRKEFNTAFGARIKVYNGRNIAAMDDTLGDLGLKADKEVDCANDMKVGQFIQLMAEAGLKVKVYTCDEWVAVLDDLTLELAGKVKKGAVRSDMMNILAEKSADDAGHDDSNPYLHIIEEMEGKEIIHIFTYDDREEGCSLDDIEESEEMEDYTISDAYSQMSSAREDWGNGDIPNNATETLDTIDLSKEEGVDGVYFVDGESLAVAVLDGRIISGIYESDGQEMIQIGSKSFNGEDYL